MEQLKNSSPDKMQMGDQQSITTLFQKTGYNKKYEFHKSSLQKMKQYP